MTPLLPYATTRPAAGSIVIPGADGPAPASWTTGHCIPRPDLGLDDGEWASWEWDGTTLTARTCPHGSIQLYYAIVGMGIVLSPSIDDVLAAGADRSLDYEAVAVFLRLGVYLGERTAFRGVRILPPGAALTWSAGSLAIASSIRDRVPVEKSLSFDAAVDGYLDLMAAAVRRRQPTGPFAMPLSGGRDSRHILLELLRQGHRPALALTSTHYLLDSLTDVQAATALAARFDVRHERLHAAPYSFARQAQTIHRVNYSTHEHVWALTLAERLKAFAISYDGHGGSLYGRPRFGAPENVVLVQEKRYDELVDSMLGPRRWVEDLLGDGARARMSHAVAAPALREELVRYRSWPNPLQGYWFWNRNRRVTATIPFSLMRDIPTVFCPLDDRDLVEFAFSLPAHISADLQWQAAAIRRGFPEAADVPFNHDLWSPRPPSAWYANRSRHVHQARYAVDLLRVLQKHGSDLIDVRRVAKYAASNWLQGGGAQFDTLPPVVTYLLTLEAAARR
jgi:asparagine synthase (glutamine-hydrolysing)